MYSKAYVILLRHDLFDVDCICVWCSMLLVLLLAAKRFAYIVFTYYSYSFYCSLLLQSFEKKGFSVVLYALCAVYICAHCCLSFKCTLTLCSSSACYFDIVRFFLMPFIILFNFKVLTSHETKRTTNWANQDHCLIETLNDATCTRCEFFLLKFFLVIHLCCARSLHEHILPNERGIF